MKTWKPHSFFLLLQAHTQSCTPPFFRSSQAASPRFLIASFSANSLLKPFLISLPILFPFFPQAHSIFSTRLFPLFPKPISLLLSYCKPFPKPIPDHLAHPPFDTPFSHYKVKYFISHTQMFLNLFSSFIKLFLQVVINNKSAHTFWGQLTSLRTERPAHALGEVFHWQ